MRSTWTCLLFTAVFCSSAIAQNPATDPVARTLFQSGIRPGDSLQMKTNLLLHLLNDTSYMKESSPDPKMKDRATFKSTPLQEANKLLHHYQGETSSGDLYNPYNLDSVRTPKEMLEQRIGGSCGTKARSFAELLQASGVPASDIRIVSTVTLDDYDELCPGGKKSKLNPTYTGTPGHVFVLVRTSGDQWKLINTTYPPLGPASIRTNGRHNDLINQSINQIKKLSPSKEDQIKKRALMAKLLRTLDPSDIEMKDFPSPTEIEKKLKAGKTVQVPEFQSLPESLPGTPKHPVTRFRKMMIFQVSQPNEYPKHTYTQRNKLIASGNVNGSTCRFSLPDSGSPKIILKPKKGVH